METRVLNENTSYDLYSSSLKDQSDHHNVNLVLSAVTNAAL